MSTNYSPKIVRNGLVYYLDAFNPKSYPGVGDTWYDVSRASSASTRTNNAGYGGQVVYNTAGYWDYTVNSPALSSNTTAYTGNGFTSPGTVVPTTGGFTISVFFLRDTTVKALGDRETFFSNAGSSEGYRFGLAVTGIYYLIGGTAGAGYQEGAIGPTVLTDGKWHMATIVYDRAATFGSYTVYSYIDGRLNGSTTISSGLTGNTAFAAATPGVGYAGCCDTYAGFIGSLMVYNRCLSATEVLQNWNALKGRYGLT